mgnify:CR=1 FL=1
MKFSRAFPFLKLLLGSKAFFTCNFYQKLLIKDENTLFWLEQQILFDEIAFENLLPKHMRLLEWKFKLGTFMHQQGFAVE